MKVCVLGAGLAGVTTAYLLAKDGHEVVVVDREEQVASAASRANGGIVATSRAFPWPNPQMAGTILRALVRNDQAVRLRFQLDPFFWRWGLRFLSCCTPEAFEDILERKVRLVKYSQAQLGLIVAESGIDYGRLTNGVMFIYRTPAALQKGLQRVERMRHHGFTTRVLDPAAAVAVEPALAPSRERLAGVIHCESDEAGDSARFCAELAKASGGVDYRMKQEIHGLEVEGNKVAAVRTSAGRIAADAFVCALGVIDPRLRNAFGVPLPVYPVRGHSLTVPIVQPAAAPAHAGMDESKLIAFCPMGGKLRVTGGAEFAGYGVDAEDADFRRLYDAMNELFPGATDYAGATRWVCRRPMTHDSLPRFGTAKYRNLWFNIGQGHMGWAMAPGSARITADLVSGRKPAIDTEGLLI
jgi:D-amino-acid dehydrogenase